jgi:hypothetical protein
LLDEKSKKKLFRLCLESLLFVDPQSRQKQILERKKDAKVLLERYFPVALPVWKQQLRQFLLNTTQSQAQKVDQRAKQLGSLYVDSINSMV